jgi:hypothetical protein
MVSNGKKREILGRWWRSWYQKSPAAWHLRFVIATEHHS